MFWCHMSLKDGLTPLFLVWASGGRDGAEGLPRVVAAWDPPQSGCLRGRGPRLGVAGYRLYGTPG